MSSPIRLLQVIMPAVPPFDSHLGITLLFRFDPEVRIQPESSGFNRMPLLQPDVPSDELAIGYPKTNELRRTIRTH